MTRLTALEFAFLNNVAHSQYSNVNGAKPETLDDVGTVWFWADEMASALGISEKAVGGVITSLQEKGLIDIFIASAKDKRNGDDSSVSMTEAGFSAWKKETSVNEQKTKPAPKAKAKAKVKPANLKEAPKSAIANREAWLKKVGTAMVPHIEGFAEKSTGRKIKFKEWRVSCGWPSKGGLPGNKRRVRGQCWDSSVSGDSNCEIYISPVEAEAREVADILAHELVHALLGTAIGHKAPFPQIVKAMGLEGKATATFAGPEFWTWAQPIIDKAGPYPHAALSPRNQGKVAKTYLIKASAPCCGSVLRLTQKVIDNSGMPLCGCSGEAISYEEA